MSKRDSFRIDATDEKDKSWETPYTDEEIAQAFNIYMDTKLNSTEITDVTIDSIIKEIRQNKSKT